MEELAQAMLNNHIMVSTVTSELQEYKNRNQTLNAKVRSVLRQRITATTAEKAVTHIHIRTHTQV